MPFGTNLVSRSAAAFGLVASLLINTACTTPGPNPAFVQQTSPDRIVLLSVPFAFDSHRLRPDSYLELNNLASAMLSPDLSGYRFEIDGHTDRSGRFAYNIALSQLRADAVIQYLASRGVPPSMMFAQGFGYTMPADAMNPYSPANRRVEVVSIR